MSNFLSIKIFPSKYDNVWKYVFELTGAIVESVLYKYNIFEERTVMCCSVQSGCKVGCSFCGTGKYFIRNLTANEIIDQVAFIFRNKHINTSIVKKLQIMFMSMGEPFHNYDNVKNAIIKLNELYPNAELLVSTILPNDDIVALIDFLELSKKINKIGLQFSVHKSTDKQRNKLILYKQKYSLIEMARYGETWNDNTNRKTYINYCIDGNNNTMKDFYNLTKLFNKDMFCFTFSVICSKNQGKPGGFCNLSAIREFEFLFKSAGYDTRIFDPAGQADGMGCGQLFYTQEYLKLLSGGDKKGC